MRRFLVGTVSALVVALVVLPTALGRMSARRSDAPPAAPAPAQIDSGDSKPVRVYFPATREIREIPLGEYIKGVVAAEMPGAFEMEALKAQFVVARTFTVRRMQAFQGPDKIGCPLNPKADVCADVNSGQAYLSLDDAKKKFGYFAATNLWQRLDKAASETAGQVLVYRGELIEALYHSVSGRMTEDAGEYFGQSLPYLKPVDDHWGASAPRLVESRQFKPEELARLLSVGGKAVPALATGGSRAPVQVASKTPAGRVKTVRVAGVTFTGKEFRERLGLRSTDFTVAVQNGSVTITTRGYGHGLGMSQYGANGMAKDGKTYQQILIHYYSGARLSHIFGE